MSLSVDWRDASSLLPLRCEVSVHIDGGSAITDAVVHVDGELDALSLPVFVDVMNLFTRPDCRHVTVDLSGAEFVSADVLRTIDEMAQQRMSSGLTMSFVGLPRSATRVAELVDLLSICDTTEDRTDAETTTDRSEVVIDQANAGSVEITLRGEFDIANAKQLWSSLEPVHVHPESIVTLHLEHVSFASSSVLSVLIRFDRTVRGEGGRLRIADVSEAVERLLILTGTADMLGLANSAS